MPSAPQKKTFAWRLPWAAETWTAKTILPSIHIEDVFDGYHHGWVLYWSKSRTGISDYLQLTREGPRLEATVRISAPADSPQLQYPRLIIEQAFFVATEEGFRDAIAWAESKIYDPMELLAEWGKATKSNPTRRNGVYFPAPPSDTLLVWHPESRQGWGLSGALQYRWMDDRRDHKGEYWQLEYWSDGASLRFLLSNCQQARNSRFGDGLLTQRVAPLSVAGASEIYAWAEGVILDPLEQVSRALTKRNPGEESWGTVARLRKMGKEKEAESMAERLRAKTAKKVGVDVETVMQAQKAAADLRAVGDKIASLVVEKEKGFVQKVTSEEAASLWATAKLQAGATVESLGLLPVLRDTDGWKRLPAVARAKEETKEIIAPFLAEEKKARARVAWKPQESETSRGEYVESIESSAEELRPDVAIDREARVEAAKTAAADYMSSLPPAARLLYEIHEGQAPFPGTFEFLEKRKVRFDEADVQGLSDRELNKRRERLRQVEAESHLVRFHMGGVSAICPTCKTLARKIRMSREAIQNLVTTVALGSVGNVWRSGKG